MRRLCLDIGEVRIGVAVSDAAGKVATPLTVLDARGVASDPRPFSRLVADYEIDEIVVGLPLSLDGSEGPQASDVRRQAARLAGSVSAPFVFFDERLSTVEAERAMKEAGADAVQRRRAVDMVAASIVLQTYLESVREDDE